MSESAPPSELGPAVAAALRRGFHASHSLAASLNDLSIAANLRGRLAAACQMVAQDHHAAILSLIEIRLQSSALALVRPLFESYVRGLWLASIATDAEVEGFAGGREPPPIKTLLAAIRTTQIFAGGTLTKAHTKHWNELCSYTHTGATQAHGWLSQSAIEPNYPASVLVKMMDFASVIAILSGIACTALAENEELAENVSEILTEFARQGEKFRRNAG